MARSQPTRDTCVLGDVGSTFIKLAAVGADGQVLGGLALATTHGDIAHGITRGRTLLAEQLALDEPPPVLSLSSSAGGGLRVLAVGLERELTLKAASRACATAGARIVGLYTDRELGWESADGLDARQPDLALLAGGTDGGDTRGVVQSARRLRSLAPALPVVVAGNTHANAAVRAEFDDGRPLRFVDNVMPRVGEFAPSAAQHAIRDIFITHVMGRGRFSSAISLAKKVRMPTPAAVLAAAEAIAELAGQVEPFARPIVVDVGGATTDVHSVMAGSEADGGYAGPGLPDAVVTRTVEGDLGLRENAVALLDVARLDGYLDVAEADLLCERARRRAADIEFLSCEEEEAAADERLGELAVSIALHRHAGTVKTTLTAQGAVLRRTGRDLRTATCVVVTGGVFAHSARAGAIVRGALRAARCRGALIPPDLPVFRDQDYLLWAAGLARDALADGPRAILEMTLEPV